MFSWLLLDPSGNRYMGIISPLTLTEARSLRAGWFKWAKYMQRQDRTHVRVYKLQRIGYADILGIVSIFYNDGVVIDSLEIAPHSRRMPTHQRRYTNLCDIMIGFSGLYGYVHHNDPFIGLVPKTDLRSHYQSKYNAKELGAGFFGIDIPVISKLIRLYYIQGDDHNA